MEIVQIVDTAFPNDLRPSLAALKEVSHNTEVSYGYG